MRVLGRHGADSVVAFGRKGPRTASDLLRDVAKVASALPSDEHGKESLLCFRSDRYEFAVALFASWQVGLRAVLPPNLQLETISRLIASRDRVALLHDTEVAGHLLVEKLLEGEPAQPLSALAEPQGPVASVLTSGSSGESQVWQKTLSQLLGETAVWSQVLQSETPPRVVATVQPGHLYGLLFSLLYPLCTGGAFLREIPFSPQAISEAVRVHQANTLVTVPVHLRSAQVLDAGSLPTLETVISSTAPLHVNDQQLFCRRHGAGITEIFGSTETGGVAYRRREQDELWVPLPGVHVGVSPQGRLVVDSPFASVGLPRPYETRDRVEISPSGCFESFGRDDSVVKIAGKRVDIAEQEAWLLAQPEVQDAAIVDVADQVRGARLLALLAAAESPQQELRKRMAERFGVSVIPKRFVMVHALPRGPNGKLSRQDILALFGTAADGKPLPSNIEVLENEGVSLSPHAAMASTPDAVAAEHDFVCGFAVPQDFLWFRGHFPGYPVMAGVVQLLSVVMPLLRRVRPGLGEIRTMEGLKFTGRIGPGDALIFCAQFLDDAQHCAFSIRKGERALTAGRLIFFAAAPATAHPEAP